jgi:hypothetical protein
MGGLVVAGDDAEDGQLVLAFIEADRKAGRGISGYEYAVLVTNTDYEVLSLGQLYRDRADAENAFDELKNNWFGVALPPMTCIVVNSLLVAWHWPITGGACLFVWPITKRGLRRSPADPGPCPPLVGQGHHSLHTPEMSGMNPLRPSEIELARRQPLVISSLEILTSPQGLAASENKPGQFSAQQH